MRGKQVDVGAIYEVKVSGKLARVKIMRESRYGGWDGLNLDTNKSVRIKTVAKLRRRIV